MNCLTKIVKEIIMFDWFKKKKTPEDVFIESCKNTSEEILKKSNENEVVIPGLTPKKYYDSTCKLHVYLTSGETFILDYKFNKLYFPVNENELLKHISSCDSFIDPEKKLILFRSAILKMNITDFQCKELLNETCGI